MKLWTIQVSKWRLAKERSIRFMDTTVKSGYSLFAPTWDMVLAHKRGPDVEGGMTDEQYSKLYRDMLVRSWQTRRQEWMNFLQDDDMYALACYCQEGKFCHRHLLIKFLRQLCTQLKIPFEYYGELTDNPTEEKDQ
jgi:hypothetical protein